MTKVKFNREKLEGVLLSLFRVTQHLSSLSVRLNNPHNIELFHFQFFNLLETCSIVQMELFLPFLNSLHLTHNFLFLFFYSAFLIAFGSGFLNISPFSFSFCPFLCPPLLVFSDESLLNRTD